MNNFTQLVEVILNIVNLIIPLIFGITLALIIWKVTKTWIIDGGDPAGVEAGKQTVVAAVIALTVMASIWGIIRVLQSSLGF